MFGFFKQIFAPRNKELRKRIFVEEQGIGNEIIEDKDEKTLQWSG